MGIADDSKMRKKIAGNIPVKPIRPDYDSPNYDPAKIAPYTLEDPLTFLSGEKVASPHQWQQRRKEILEIFAREMYGQEPPPPECVKLELVEEKEDALAGKSE